MQTFSDTLRGAQAEPGTLCIFWLEQSHFVIKNPQGVLVHIDPFLSRVVKPEQHIHPEPLANPEEVPADIVFVTHDHRDHTDPHTLGPMARHNPGCVIVGPRESCDRCVNACGIERARLREAREGDVLEFPGFTARVVFALDTDDPPKTTHMGYVFDFGGLIVYHTGDTRQSPASYFEQMEAVRDLRPDVLLVPINTGYSNPGPDGAAELARFIRPRLIVPCHFGCFRHNTIEPGAFTEAAPDLADITRVLPRGGVLTIHPPIQAAD